MKLTIKIDKYIIAHRLLTSNNKYDLKNVVFNKFKNITILNEFLVTTDFLNIKNQIKMFRKEIPCSLIKFVSGHDTLLQNKMWKKYRYAYRFMQLCIKHNLAPFNTINHIVKVMNFTIKHPLFVDVLNDTNDFLREISTEWNVKKDRVLKIVEDITKIDVFQDFKATLYVTNKKLNAGRNISKYYSNKNAFIYGHTNLCDNYNMMYLIHESLHSIFGSSEIEHAIIELIADNELRIRLNNTGKYFEYGHDYLHSILVKLIPDWQMYLTSDENIYDFKNRMLVKHNM